MSEMYERFRPKSLEDFGALRLLNDETMDPDVLAHRRLIVLLCDQPGFDAWVLEEVTGLRNAVSYARDEWQAGHTVGEGFELHQQYLWQGETHLRWQLHLALEQQGWLEMEASLIWLVDLLEQRIVHKRQRDHLIMPLPTSSQDHGYDL
jgi:hypothetical protein